MIERHLRVLELRRADGGPVEERPPVPGGRQRQRGVGRVQVGQVDEVLERAEARGDAAQLIAPIEGLAPVAVPVDGEEHLRRELREAVERAPLTKSGEQHAQIAPMAVVASIAIMVSGMFGIQATTRSPGSSPRARSSVARVRTRLPSASQLKAVSGCVSLTWKSTLPPPASRLSTCCA